MKGRLLGLFLLSLPVLAASQFSGSLLGPSLGFVFDGSTGTVRPLLGISGSTTVGAPVDAGIPLINGISLSDQRSILAIPESGPFLLSVDMGVTPPFIRTIEGAVKSADITLSPNGTTAALVSRGNRLIQVITGLPNHPVVAFEISTTPVDGQLQRAVVNDSADALLITLLQGDGEIIYRWTGSEGYRVLASTLRVGALGFVGNSDAVYADGGSNEVFLAQNVKIGSVTQFLAGAPDGVSGPIGIAPSRKGGFFLANSISGTILTFDENRRILRTQQCDCTVTGIYPLSPGIFRLTDRLNQTIYLLDDARSEPQLTFIPPAQ